jgi:hypothetical protein
MTTRPKMRAVLTAAALLAGGGSLAALAPSASAAASSGWVCAYTAGKAGKACFSGETAQVCDLASDGRRVSGSFAVRGRGVGNFADVNGAGGGCSYRNYGAPITSVSAYFS